MERMEKLIRMMGIDMHDDTILDLNNESLSSTVPLVPIDVVVVDYGEGKNLLYHTQ